MEFQLLGETVAIDTLRESYNHYRLMFQQEAEQAAERFETAYQTNTSLEMAVKNVPDQMYQSAAPALRRCIQILLDNGVVTIDEDQFVNMYSDVWNAAMEAYLKIQDQYAEIALSEEEKDAYRKARRESRGRFIGFGRGIGGALKSAAGAGTLNALTGAGHMLFNGVAKIGSSIAASSKMNKIFRSKDTLRALTEGLYHSVFALHLALLDCLAQTGVDSQTIGGAVPPQDSNRASAILRNIPQISDLNQRRSAMLQAFRLDPYQEDWYLLALQYFGDPDCILETVEQHFGVSAVRREKERVLDEFARRMPLDTEEQALLAAKKIAEKKASLNYSGETKATEAILAAVDRFDREYRTVDGITFSTRQEAEQLRIISQDLKEDLKSCGDGIEAEDALLQFREKLQAEDIPDSLKNIYLAEADHKLSLIDKKLRTTMGKEYPTREAAREAEQQYQQIRTDFSSGNPRKKGDKFREQIAAMDVSEEIKKELQDELFHRENTRELKTAKTFRAISSAILLVIIIASYFFHLSGTTAFSQKNIVVGGISLMITDVQPTDQLTFLDGLKNGLVVFGRSFGDIFVDGFFSYTGGFNYGLTGNIIWAVAGLFWVIIKHFFIGIGRYVVSLFVTLFQTAPVVYYLGYVIGSAIPIAVSQLSFDEDEPEENVRKIKGWTVKKIGLTILVIVLIAAVVMYFAGQEL